MLKILKRLLILTCVLALAIPLYAQNKTADNSQLATEAEKTSEEALSETAQTSKPEKTAISRFLDFINKKAYAAKIDKKEEKRILREKWKELLNIDIFYPYFKAKEVEDWISDKTKVEFFNFRGRAKFEDGRFKYTFKLKF